MGVSSAEYTLEKTMTLGDFFVFKVPKIGCFSTNVFVKPNEQNRACSSYAMARKRRMKSNVFVKPNEQNRACSSYAMARKRRMKSNVFVKPNEQNRACSRYAMARKGRMKSNVPLGESAFLCYLLHNKLYHNAPKSIKLNKAKSRG